MSTEVRKIHMASNLRLSHQTLFFDTQSFKGLAILNFEHVKKPQSKQPLLHDAIDVEVDADTTVNPESSATICEPSELTKICLNARLKRKPVFNSLYAVFIYQILKRY